MSDGTLLIGYGDYGANTGPIDVLGWHPTNGVTTLLADTDTEQIMWARILNDGYAWVPSVDPRGSSAGSLATNAPDGVWGAVEVSIAGTSVVEHMFDVTQTSDGALYCCGSRQITVAEGNVSSEDATAACVWRSVDGGATWVEDLTYLGSHHDATNRFYGFAVAGDTLAVCCEDNSGYWVRTGTGWSAKHAAPPAFSNATRPVIWGATSFAVAGTGYRFDGGAVVADSSLIPAGTYVTLASDGDRYLCLTGLTSEHELIDTERGSLGVLNPALSVYRWSAAYGSNGSIWLCDGDAIYLLPPPD